MLHRTVSPYAGCTPSDNTSVQGADRCRLQYPDAAPRDWLLTVVDGYSHLLTFLGREGLCKLQTLYRPLTTSAFLERS
jgi:hypothetical protein